MSSAVEARATGRPTRRRTGLTPAAVVAFAVIGLALVCAVFGNSLVPQDPALVKLSDKLLPPMSTGKDGAGHLLGTDALGRDVLSRLIAGARVSVVVALGVVVIGVVVGTTLGLVAGLRGRRTDVVIMRLIDALHAFPGLLFVILMITFVGPELSVLIGVLGFFAWMIYARLVRSRTMQLKHSLHVRAATIIGASQARVVRRYLLPALVPVIANQALLDIARVILAEASLSYLGLGIQPPDVSWGLMVAENQQYLATAWWTVFFPGACIAGVVLSVNVVARWFADRAHRSLRFGAPESLVLASAVEGTELATDPLLEEDAAELLPTAAPALDADATTRVTVVPAVDRDALLSVTGLRVDYFRGDEVVGAVRGVSWRVAPGECLAIVGESGSGKSTTAMAVLDLLPMSSRFSVEAMTWHGRPLAANERRKLRGKEIGFVYQDAVRRLSPLVPIGEQIAESLRLHRGATRRAAKREAIELLDAVGIADPAGRARVLPHELSGGMAQRAMIAVALAPRPSLLIADEPTASLDVTVQAQILDLLDELKQQRGLSILMISHDLGAVASIADHIAVMRDGEIVEHGATADVLVDPTHEYTTALLAATPRIEPGGRDAVVGDRQAADLVRAEARR